MDNSNSAQDFDLFINFIKHQHHVDPSKQHTAVFMKGKSLGTAGGDEIKGDSAQKGVEGMIELIAFSTACTRTQDHQTQNVALPQSKGYLIAFKAANPATVIFKQGMTKGTTYDLEFKLTQYTTKGDLDIYSTVTLTNCKVSIFYHDAFTANGPLTVIKLEPEVEQHQVGSAVTAYNHKKQSADK
jgi:type VI protein secretion system component Hcp